MFQRTYSLYVLGSIPMQPPKQRKFSILVPSISCGHCKASIEAALGALDGVMSVEVDVAAKRVEVEVDPARTDLERLEAAIEDQGHEVTRS